MASSTSGLAPLAEIAPWSGDARRHRDSVGETAPRSPNLNAYAERFVRTIKESCLDRLILFGEGSLRKAVREFIAHYHLERNHQGLGNRLLTPQAIPADSHSNGTIRRRQRLGGMLNYYHRAA